MSPPKYDFSQIDSEFTIWMTQYDNIFVRKDVDLLLSQMSNAKVELIYIPGWGHSGFMIPKSPGPLLKVIEKIKKEVAEKLAKEGKTN